jgi:response regulator RpfG family c-di-GMP phosphodiesterase
MFKYLFKYFFKFKFMQNTVLIIDDDGFDGMIISALLNQTNYKVIGHCKNGFDGIVMAEKLLPNYIIIDKLMPEMDGLQVIEKLRLLKINSKIILTSSDDLSEEKEICAKWNVFHFLQKPISRNLILNLLDSM